MISAWWFVAFLFVTAAFALYALYVVGKLQIENKALTAERDSAEAACSAVNVAFSPEYPSQTVIEKHLEANALRLCRGVVAGVRMRGNWDGES